eukprot:gene82-2344_t
MLTRPLSRALRGAQPRWASSSSRGFKPAISNTCLSCARALPSVLGLQQIAIGNLSKLCVFTMPDCLNLSVPPYPCGLTESALGDFWIGHLGLEKVPMPVCGFYPATMPCMPLPTSPVTDFRSEKENVDEDVLTVGRGLLGTVEVDLMAPLDPEKSPKVHVPALNHIGLWVDDIHAAVKYCEQNSIRVVGGVRQGASGHDVTFVHPKSACGILLELVQAPQKVIQAYKELDEDDEEDGPIKPDFF